MVARASTTMRRKVGRVKPPARQPSRERVGWGRASWTRWSLRRAERDLRARRRRRLRSRRRVRRAGRPRGKARRRLGPGERRREGVAILGMGASLVSMTASYLHCTRKAPSSPSGSKRAEVELSGEEHQFVEGIVPGLPDWQFTFSIIDRHLIHRGTGERLYVSRPAEGNALEDRDFCDYLTNHRQPGPAEQRLGELLPD